MERRVIILGATGSIGRAALDVVDNLRGQVRVVGLAAGRDGGLLVEQARRSGATHLALSDVDAARDLRAAAPSGARVFAGGDGLVELIDACREHCGANYVLSAIVGAAGLPATLRAVEHGLDVGLANKESLVVAGAVLMPLARRRGGRIIPVDSEHSAIFQALHSGRREEVRRIYLTASGGPFRTWTKERIDDAGLDDALRHPTWAMGPKITIDSATMMNKALEVIEARWLFDLPSEQIGVLVHPESIVHGLVEFHDGSIIAQLGAPDMKTPIQYAMTFPERCAAPGPALDWTQARSLNFEPVDPERFPAVRMGFEAARRGGTAGALLNAANEVAVDAFRAGRIRFAEIAQLTALALERGPRADSPDLAELMKADRWARQEIQSCLNS